jgi:hypothetical protein
VTSGRDVFGDGQTDALVVSPDGRWIVHTTTSGLAITPIAGGQSERPAWGNGATQPAWAPQARSAPPADESPAPSTGPLGETWGLATVPVVVDRPVGRIEAVTAGGPGFVAVGRGCSSTTSGDLDRCEAIVWTSTVGRTWVRAPASDATDTGRYIPMSGPEIGMFDVAAGAPGVVAIGYAARPNLQATTWFSADGISWERIPLGLEPPAASPGGLDAARVNAVTWDGRQFVIVGEDRSVIDGSLKSILAATARAAVWTSPDGRTWARVPHAKVFDVGGFVDTMEDPASGGMRDVMASPNGLVAVGSVCSNKPVGCTPASWTSVDGTTWERGGGMPAVSGLLKAVAGSGTRFTAVGAGTCDSSPVAIPQPCPALVLTSPNGQMWTQQPFEQAGDLRTLTVIGGRYFATAPDGPETVWTSLNGSAWTAADVAGGPATAGLGNFAEWHFAATPETAVWIGSPPWANDPAAWVSDRAK